MDYTGRDAGVTARLGPKLLDQVRDRLRVRHYSLRTEQAYLSWIRRFILASGKRHPAQMGQAEVDAFLTRLATDGQVSAGAQNQALAALLFLYREVLRIELPWMENLVRAKRPRRIPVVLSREEVARLLAVLEAPCWLMASLLYGSGMRLLECLRLRVKDVGAARAEIVVRDGKGGKDRRVPLPLSLRDALLRQRERALAVHAADPAAGVGRVFLPQALARKSPQCRRRTGLAIPVSLSAPVAGSAQWPGGSASRVRRSPAACGAGGTSQCRHRQAGHLAHVAPFVRDAFAGGRPRHPHGARAMRSQGRGHHADLYGCIGRGASAVRGPLDALGLAVSDE